VQCKTFSVPATTSNERGQHNEMILSIQHRYADTHKKTTTLVDSAHCPQQPHIAWANDETELRVRLFTDAHIYTLALTEREATRLRLFLSGDGSNAFPF